MRIAIAITLNEEERATLTKWSRGGRTPARVVLRAKIVLAAADGRENQDIAAELGCTRPTVGTWWNRFATDRLCSFVFSSTLTPIRGLCGLRDANRYQKPTTVPLALSTRVSNSPCVISTHLTEKSPPQFRTMS